VLSRIVTIIATVSCCVQIFAQTNSIEFQDTVANQKTGAIGYKGTNSSGYLFFETPNSPDVKVQSGSIITQGNVTAAKFYKGDAEFDSVRAAAIADSCKKMPSNIKVDTAKIAESLTSSVTIAGSQVNPSFDNSYVSTRSGYMLLNNSTNGLDIRLSIENDCFYISRYYNGMWPAIIQCYLTGNSVTTHYFGDMKIIKDGGAELIVGMAPHALGNIKITHNGNDGTISSSKGNLTLVPGTEGIVHVNGTLSAVSCGTCSDIRYKNNICPLYDPFTKIMNLNGVSFNYNYNSFPDKNFPKEKQIGFIAQDVEKVVPEIILTDEKGFKTVDYSKLTVLLVEALKTQQKMIENQQKEINSLKENVKVK
jgi:hypothetical protein